MRVKFYLLFGLFHCCLWLPVQSQTQNAKKWEVFELSFMARTSSSNPYVDGLPMNGERKLTVHFSGKDGEARGKTFVINGFWNGGKNWKLRFAPPFSGVWEYRMNSSDKMFPNKRGVLIVTDWTEEQKKENPVRKGFVFVSDTGKRAGRY